MNGSDDAGHTPEPAHPSGQARWIEVTRLAEPERGASALAIVIALAVGLAIVKPWSFGAAVPSPGPQRPYARIGPAPAPTVMPSTDESLAAPVCLGAGGWRVASLETWRTQAVRVWRAVEPAPFATGPRDPNIPSVPVAALELTALGYCSPAFGPDRLVGPAVVRIWAIVGTKFAEVSIQQVLPRVGRTPLAALYVPASECAALTETCEPGIAGPSGAQAPTWEPGRYVFLVEDEADGAEAWFAADVMILPRGEGSPAPGVSDDAAPGPSRTLPA